MVFGYGNEHFYVEAYPNSMSDRIVNLRVGPKHDELGFTGPHLDIPPDRIGDLIHALQHAKRVIEQDEKYRVQRLRKKRAGRSKVMRT
jgi:hypothetical protein